jgi:hypothetical protein
MMTQSKLKSDAAQHGCSLFIGWIVFRERAVLPAFT